MRSKIVSWVTVKGVEVAVNLIFDKNAGFDLVEDIGDGQERVIVDDGRNVVVLVVGDDIVLLLLLLLLLPLVLNLRLSPDDFVADVDDVVVVDNGGGDDDSLEDPDSGPCCAFSVPAFNEGHFSLVGGGCFFTTLSLLMLLPNLFLLLVQLLPPL